jgi:polysaccharide pyruvyl transferase CsaB
MVRQKSSVLFSGYFGFGNAGDEAVLEASIGLLRDRDPEIGISVLSADAEASSAAYKVRAYPRWQARSVARALRETELLLSGGGSLLQDRTSLRSLIYYLGVIRLALLMRRRVMVFAQGIGPLVRPAARRLTASLLRRVDLIAVRDAGSRDLLESLGVGTRGGPPVHMTADPAFALEPEETGRVRELLPSPGEARRPVIAVNLRPWTGMIEALEAIEEGLQSAAPGAQVLACPFQPAEDGPFCEALVEGLGDAGRLVKEPLRPREWRALLGRLDLVIAARLHALILAAAGGTPTLAVSYDPKVSALQKRLGAPDLGPPEQLTAGRVAAAVTEALRSGEAQAARRREVAAQLRDAAAQNASLALGLLGRGTALRGES